MPPALHHTPASVVVVGSIHADVIVRVEHLPLQGETVIGRDRTDALGGKGANQAVAAARTGVSVAMVGAVGADTEGQSIRARLSTAGVDIDAVISLADCGTGRAFVWVDDEGENSIVVVSGANTRVDAALIASAAGLIAAADVLVLQGEIHAEPTLAALYTAHRAGKRVVLNLAPFSDLGLALRHANPLIVNEVEAAQLLGRIIRTMNEEVAREVGTYAQSAVITLGAQGALVVVGDEVRHIPAPYASVITDTTGAGDAFVGVLAAALASGCTLFDAATLAARAATASIGVAGAGDQYPAFDLSITDRAPA